MTLSLSRAAWARIAPFALFMIFLAVRGAWPEGESRAVDSRWLYAIQTALVGGLLLVLWRQFGELARQNLPSARQWLLAIGVGVAVFWLWITLTAPWMMAGKPVAEFVPKDAAGRIDWLLVAFRMAGAVLVVPLMEELFWRSFLMRWIDSPVFEGVDPQTTTLKAIVLSTFVFTLAHTQWLAAALAGLAYAFLYVRTGKLWAAVGAHAVTNALLGVWVLRTENWSFW
jgi:CAAX prenyl protease-like protein